MLNTNINDEFLIKEIIKVVIDFTSRMNLWETKMYYLNRIQNGQFIKQEFYDKYKDLSKIDLYEEYRRIIAETCNIKDSVYGGDPATVSFGKPPSFNGIEESSITELKLIDKDKIEVVTKGGNLPEQYIKFILFKKNGVWLIDQLFKRIANTEWIKAYI